VVQEVQETGNDMLDPSVWVTPEHYNTFYLASLFLTNIWTYIIGIVFFGLFYWAVIYTQRKNAGGM
jgi:hypothetical protein